MSRVSGLDNVLRNLNKEIGKIENRGAIGLGKAALFIEREGIKQTPVDTGTLVHSWYVATLLRTSVRTTVEIGLTAAYAPILHERTHSVNGKRIRFKKAGAKPKFLEDPIKHNTARILDIIRSNATIR
jgi:hypothetical protein